MMSFFGLWKKDNKIIPFDKKSTPILPESLLVRPNKYIPEQAYEGDIDDETKETDSESESDDGGREVRYETTVIFSPVYVSKRNSSSDMALKSKRLVITKDEVDGLSNLLKGMALKDGNTSAKATAKTEPKAENANHLGKKAAITGDVDGETTTSSEKFGRFTKTVHLSPNSKPVQVVRSCRLSP
ncbi:hypothetical protein ACA910_014060 [Epithemia clementina (nom. ined.)]